MGWIVRSGYRVVKAHSHCFDEFQIGAENLFRFEEYLRLRYSGDEFWAQCAHCERKPCKMKEKPLDSIKENQGVMIAMVVPTGLEPVSPA